LKTQKRNFFHPWFIDNYCERYTIIWPFNKSNVEFLIHIYIPTFDEYIREARAQVRMSEGFALPRLGEGNPDNWTAHAESIPAS